MSDEQDEIPTGRAGNEAAQGWSQMVPGDPVPTGDELADVEPITEADLTHLKRPAPPEPVERAYYNNVTGEEVPEKESVTPEQAAHDLRVAREAELKAIENEAREALTAALDGTEVQHPDQQHPEPDIQPQALPPDPTGQDAEVERLLQNPTLRARVETELRQHTAVAEYARAHYAQAANALAEQVNALAVTQFPELAQFAGNPQAMGGALKMLAEQNPSRYAELQLFTQRASIVQENAQKARAEQMQAVQQRQQQEFAKYAREQDAKAFAKETPESLKQIQNFLFEDAGKAGISRELLVQTWASNVALRNSYVSELLADGAKYRMAQRGMKTARHNPVQPVIRPGVSESGPRDDSELSGLQGRFNLNPTRELAAQLIAARRNSR